MIRAGSFRQDLLYRLNLIELHLPPLAERPDDILPLVDFFLEPGKTLQPAARDVLLRHRWPGNVRELKNVLQRACLLARDNTISVADLGLPVQQGAPAEADQEPDKASIEQALARASGVIAQAAHELGLSRQALYRRMDRLGIHRP
jgi:transcriptional regulator of acetoin/glycerol metabolism